MQRFMFLTIVLIVIASTTGCRRGLRLWGVRGAACRPAYGAPPMAPPPVYQQPVIAYPAPPVCPCPPAACACPTECYVPETNCGCDTSSGDPAYGGFSVPGGQLISDSGCDIRPGETFGGFSEEATTSSEYVPGTFSSPPASQPPQLPIIPQQSSAFSE